MAELIVVGFKKDMYRASEVLNNLSDLNNDWVVDLHDAVAVYRDNKGKLRVDQSYQMTTGEGAAWGGLWGLLIGATLAIPFTAGQVLRWRPALWRREPLVGPDSASGRAPSTRTPRKMSLAFPRISFSGSGR